MEFEATHREEVYGWVTEVLCEQEYWKQKRAARGTLRQYIGKMTGLSRAQVARLIGRYKESGTVREMLIVAVHGQHQNRSLRQHLPKMSHQLGPGHAG